MARAFLTGFESGSASEVARKTGGTVVSSGVITGGYSIENPNAIVPSEFANLNLSTVYLKARLKIASGTNPGSQIVQDFIAAYNVSSVLIASVQTVLETDGTIKLRLYNNVTASQIGSDYTISANTVYNVELKIVRHASTGSLELRVDEISRASGTNLNTGASNVDYTPFGTGILDTRNVTMDDLEGDNAAWCGLSKVGKRQGRSGTPTDDLWTKTGLSNAYQCWGETPFSTTNACNSGSLTGQKAQTMWVESVTTLVGASGTINGCQIVAVAKTSATTSNGYIGNIRKRINGGAATDYSTTISTSDVFYPSTIFTDTLSNLDLIEIGWNKGTSSAARTHTVEDIWLMVSYTEATATRRVFIV